MSSNNPFSRVFHTLAFTGALISGLTMAGATAAADLRFAADWAFQGPQAPFLLPHENGCYDKAGLDVVTDRGFGSGDTITKVSTGAYDVGFADINAMLEFNTRNPDDALIAIFVIYDGSPLSIITRKDTGVTQPSDLVGKSIAAPPGDASRRLFGLLAKANDFDENDVDWKSVSPELRESTLARKQADAIAGHAFTGYIGAKAAGVPEDQLVVMRYAENGVPLYGSSLVTRPAFAEEHPEALTRFIGCVAQAFMESARDPEGTIEVLAKKDPLTDKAVEQERLQLSLDWSVATPWVVEHGMSQVDPKRLADTTGGAARALGIAVPNPDDVYTDAYLPDHETLTWTVQ